ncbi:UNVERIFIED_ORG: chromosomal replication initiation ATPase DnaA [Rhizobium esperanzae]|uniref:Chromosomal replication initiator/regulator protein n=1 Tax=Rhizobium phaseoli TaxID=396 RepID=A0A192T8W4_9HYPH|nr:MULTISPECIES: DnaA regulatory inactivator HdaA [Rhizobium]MDH6650483.1 chromosomal replication initiation ATPase DnaA [Rhizobium esperanzae]ANL39970.1 chromosomal replication initiator/regulator protein [Rhizobium phaseoli]ANL52673.1 chromosomal replication initiator/regulator protein [Rhizobium phaseoli]ANL58959.1 chromosomal replication initiator/regulator protein [Rhizobium phaseoli]ANL84286.1 chromosomal replication initiator/regulator protein [Rhizobium phaseoli]
MNDVKNADPKRKAGEQLPLVFSHDAASGRDDLLISERLAAAVSIVDAWPAWPSPVVVLAGPVGSGKSHLARIWRELSGAVDIRPDLGSDAAVAAAAGPVLFEDADRLGFDDNALFHVINSVREHGTSLLMTSRLWPISWPVLLPDLRSRLKAATVVEIGEPDEALLSQVIVKLFADRQLYIDDKLVLYIVNRMERSLNAAQTIVERLDRLALSRGTKITRSLAAEVLNELGNSEPAD